MFYIDVKFNGSLDLSEDLEIGFRLCQNNCDTNVDINIMLGQGLFIEGFYSSIKEPYLAYGVLCWALNKIKNNYPRYNKDTEVSLLAIGKSETKNQAGLFLYYMSMGFLPQRYDNVQLYTALKDVPKDKLTTEMLLPFVRDTREAEDYLDILLNGEVEFSTTLGILLENYQYNKNVQSKTAVFCKDGKMPIRKVNLNGREYIAPETLPQEIHEFLSC